MYSEFFWKLFLLVFFFIICTAARIHRSCQLVEFDHLDFILELRTRWLKELNQYLLYKVLVAIQQGCEQRKNKQTNNVLARYD